MASTKTVCKSFKVKADKLNVWVNEYQNKTLIHFRQISHDKDEPKKHYLFTSAGNIAELQLCALKAADFEFESAIVESRESDDGETYVIELVRVEQTKGHHFLLQTRNIEYEKPLRYVKITDIYGFQDVVAKASEAYTKMFFKKERANVQKRQNKPHDDDDESPKKLKVAETDGAELFRQLFAKQMTFSGANDGKNPLPSYEDEMTRSSFPEAYKPRNPKMMF